MRHTSKEVKIKQRKELYGPYFKTVEFREASKEFRKKLANLKEEKKRAKKLENRKALKKIKKLTKKERLNKFADLLNADLPSSEKWFWRKYKLYEIESDKSNIPLGPFIYDVLNQEYKYIAEIDGSFHNKDSQKIRDQKKDDLAIKRGYKIFRIVAYNDESFNEAIKEILSIRIKKEKSKVILRKP